MSFDKETRNLLARMVTTCRRRLVEDVTDQLTGIFGLHPDGTRIPVDKLTHLSPDQISAANHLRELLEHYIAGAAGKDQERYKAAYERVVLEVSFTSLNRLAALRLCEERDLVIECVRKGTASAGFQMFETVSGGALGPRFEAYKAFLHCMFDELAIDLGVLFDRTTPQSKVFPSESCLEDVLSELNKPDLNQLWTEDETIGWIYQYFNPPEERKRMREESQAPRNSRELAVRNQFFTPRYVVQFLTDNTLGRIWYEMRKGDTALADECDYLVQRPNEIFLEPGQAAPEDAAAIEGITQEELLKQPVYIKHRSKKDPRDLKILDPASGSGHFLLYAFDLLERIYEEAWGDDDLPVAEATGTALREDFEDINELRLQVPRLIIEHNLHGIDIDPRAVQIAALALWLRAQRNWQTLGLKAHMRPKVTRSNIVTAEPMPGEVEMLDEFLRQLKGDKLESLIHKTLNIPENQQVRATERMSEALCELVKLVWDEMKLAGEAGSLLKIEEALSDAIKKAREEWEEKTPLFRVTEFSLQESPKTKYVRVIPGEEEDFWSQAEILVTAALEEYAEQTSNGRSIGRRLFVNDAAQGFAFIDLCRKRYDTVLMNPPFGLSPKSVFGYLKEAYSDTYVDLYACSVTRGRTLAPFGSVGAITSRAFLTTKKLVRWRTNEVVEELQVLLDLGLGVMDDAFVEACAFVLSEPAFPAFVAFNRRDTVEKSALIHDPRSADTYVVDRTNIKSLPASKILYSVSPRIHTLLRNKSVFEPNIGTAREGLRTFDDFRFLRLRWEVPPICIGSNNTWEPLAKGGEFARYYSDLSLLVRWATCGKELAEENRKVNGQVAQSRQASEYYRRAGGTYSKRSAKGFSIRALPAGCIIGTKGPAVLSESKVLPAYIIGWLNSRLIRSLIHIQANAYEFNTGILKRLPWQYADEPEKLVDEVLEAIHALRREARLNEANSCFITVILASSITEMAERIARLSLEVAQIIATCQTTCDETIDRLYAVDSTSLTSLSAENADDSDGDEYRENFEEDSELPTTQIGDGCTKAALELISYCLGVCIGRWDVRIAFDQSLVPKLPDPFDPLPVCPPGMLVGPDGFPAASNRIVSEEWLRFRPDANSLPPQGSVSSPTIPDSDYSLRISWDGVLVDDSTSNSDHPHRDDIARRVREVLDLLWKGKAHEIEQEACEFLGVSEFGDYFSKPTGYFQDHLKRYSKSRRKAPIYWPLSTSSGSYTIWLYYHRLNDQTLYTVVNNFVEPRIAEAERKLQRLEHELGAAAGAVGTKMRDDLDELKKFTSELHDFRDDLLRVAELPYKPNLNDGVIINAAPLHKLFRLRSWANDTEAVWKKLEKGEYDWAHLAYTIWPERVREVCKHDRSIALAHGLEELCEVEAPKPKKNGKRGRSKKETS